MSYKIIGDNATFVWDSGLPREKPFRLRNADVATFEAFGFTWAREKLGLERAEDLRARADSVQAALCHN